MNSTVFFSFNFHSQGWRFTKRKEKKNMKNERMNEHHVVWLCNAIVASDASVMEDCLREGIPDKYSRQRDTREQLLGRNDASLKRQPFYPGSWSHRTRMTRRVWRLVNSTCAIVWRLIKYNECITIVTTRMPRGFHQFSQHVERSTLRW